MESIPHESDQGNAGATHGSYAPEVNARRSVKMKSTTNRRVTGIHTGKSLLKFWGTLNLDGRLPIVKERNAWLERLIAGKGGRENLSELQLTDYERLADLWVILKGGTLAVMNVLPSTSLVSKRKKAFHPIVLELFRMSESFGRQCYQAGIERTPAPVPSLPEYLAQKDRERETQQSATEPSPADSKRSHGPVAQEIPPQETTTQEDSMRFDSDFELQKNAFTPEEPEPPRPPDPPPSTDPTVNPPTREERQAQRQKQQGQVRRCTKCGTRLFVEKSQCDDCKDDRR